MTQIDWIGLDWGTSRLRAFAMTAGGDCIGRLASDAGMVGLARTDFEPALTALIAGWLREDPMPIVAAGMVGARQGWIEAPYISVPTIPLEASQFISPAVSDRRLRIAIVPGLSQDRPADVMRGEETQIAGFLRTVPDFDGVLCMPGSHSKWARVSAGEVVGFRTFMTGELFALLSTQSVLRHSVGEGWDAKSFCDGVNDSLSNPEMFAARLFSLRAEDLLRDTGAARSAARLSGLLIGLELAGARSWWLGQRIALIGEGGLCGHYRTALDRQGVDATIHSGDEMVVAGLIAARAAWGKQ